VVQAPCHKDTWEGRVLEAEQTASWPSCFTTWYPLVRNQSSMRQKLIPQSPRVTVYRATILTELTWLA